MTFHRHLPAQALLTLSLALGLAACGGGGGGGGSGAGATSGPAATPVAPGAPGAAASSPDALASAPGSGQPAGAVDCSVGGTSALASASFSLINVVRTSAGLAAFTPLAALDGTAQAHARYLTVNGGGSTAETPGRPCFTGATPEQRFAAAGVALEAPAGVRSHTESVLAYPTSSGQAVVAWDVVNDALNNLYGRMLMLTPAPQHAGLGLSVQSLRRALVLDTVPQPGAMPADGGAWLVWPRDAATGVPARMLAFDKKPLDVAVEGYPVTLHALAPVQVARFVLTEAASGTPVAATVITSASDRHGFLSVGEAALVPHAPLAAGTQYRAELDATVGTQAIHRTWSFTTAP